MIQFASHNPQPSGSEPATRTGSSAVALTTPAGLITSTLPDQIVKPIHALKVIVNLLSREAVRVKRGERVEITQWGGHVPRKARVERIEPFGRSTISALGIEEQHVNLVILFDAVSATILNPVKCAYRRFTGPGPVTGPLGKMSLAFGTQDWKTS